MYHIFSLKRASNKISAKRDLETVLSFLKAKLKHELDVARSKNFASYITSPIISEASSIVDSVIKDIEEIRKLTGIEKENIIKSKKTLNAKLSPDEDYTVEISSLRYIKKSGLLRPLTKEEKTILKNATNQANNMYSINTKDQRRKVNVR
ncbi:MAG: hypothetical protein JW985_00980 [Alphaproteobacteria bacterium]|jgi:hypothetical protein|nr:hypothetical protein [Alphaproteobacteria bacterium]